MQKINIFIFLFIALLQWNCGGDNTQNQKADTTVKGEEAISEDVAKEDSEDNKTTTSKTIEDYFKILQAKGVIPKKDESKGIREINIKTKDLINGYMSFSIPFSDFGLAEMTLWNGRKNGKDLVALAHAGCGPICGLGFPTLYEFDGDKYEDVTEKMIPVEEVNAFLQQQIKANESYCFNVVAGGGLLLPAKGLDIELILYCPLQNRPEEYKRVGLLKYKESKFEFEK
jgi:hypothetical protein